MLVVGDTPIAGAVARLGAELDLDVVTVPGADVEPAADDLALVVAAHGRDELHALRRALEAGLPYVGLVASRVRGAAVVAELQAEGVADRAPGGARDAGRARHRRAHPRGDRALDPRRGSSPCAVASRRCRCAWWRPREVLATAIDPVCGMAVAAAEQTPHVDHEGRRVYFCCDGCRTAFEHDPPRYLTAH